MPVTPDFKRHSPAGLVLALLIAAQAALAVPDRAGAEPRAPDPAETPIPQREVWAVLSGGSLKATIEGWARVTGWTVVWDNPVDYRIRASATFHGDFEEAVARLVDAIHQRSPELTVTLYRGNRVLHVEDASLLRN